MSIHDVAVLRTAAGYKGKGYKVMASKLRGYSEPPTLNHRIPDVYAVKGKDVVVVEVETPASLKRDRNQLLVFGNHCISSGCRFRIIVTDGRELKFEDLRYGPGRDSAAWMDKVGK